MLICTLQSILSTKSHTIIYLLLLWGNRGLICLLAVRTNLDSHENLGDYFGTSKSDTCTTTLESLFPDSLRISHQSPPEPSKQKKRALTHSLTNSDLKIPNRVKEPQEIKKLSCLAMETTPSESSSTPSTTVPKKKQGLGWVEWLRGWMYILYEMLFQRIMASHLQNPLSLPPINNLTCIVTGSTSGIGLQIARQLAESGAHVVMAVRNTKAAHDLIHKWQSEWTGLGLPLNIEVGGSLALITV